MNTELPQELTGKNGFKNFLYLAWKAIQLPDPTPVQYDMADWMQNGPRHEVTIGYRGVGKSYIAACFCCWTWLLNPDAIILVVSGSKDRADQFSTFTLSLLGALGDLTRHLLPRDGQRESKVSFDIGPAGISGSASCTSKGIFSQITGSRADIIIADDVVTAQNAQTQTLRDKIALATKEFTAILKPKGRIMYLGTPQSEQDLLHDLPSLGFSVRMWPAEIPGEKLLDRQGDRIAPMILKMAETMPAGTPTDPLRFDVEELEERRLQYGRTGYAMQFLLDQTLADMERYPLKIPELMVADLDPKVCFEQYIWANDPSLRWGHDLPCPGFKGDYWYRPLRTLGEMVKYQGIVMAIDPSGRGKDETAYAVVAAYGGQLFVLDLGGMDGGYEPAVLDRLVTIAKANGVNRILVEENFGQGMFASLLRPVLLAHDYRCTIEEVRHSIQKEHRICDVLEPVVNAHKLIVNRSVITQDWETVRHRPVEDQRNYLWGHQFSRITRDKGSLRHDDRLDALAMAVEFWVRAVAQDGETQMAKTRDQRWKAAMKEFMRHAIGGPKGGKPKGPKFFQARPDLRKKNW